MLARVFLFSLTFLALFYINYSCIASEFDRPQQESQSISERVKKYMSLISHIFGVNSRELEQQALSRITKQKKLAHSRFTRELPILYPSGRVLLSNDDKIIVGVLDSRYRLIKLSVNGKAINIASTQPFVEINKNLLSYQNQIDIFYEAYIEGKLIRNRTPFTTSFELVKIEDVDLLSQHYHKSLEFRDPLDRITYRFLILEALNLKQNENFEFDYDLTKYAFLLSQIKEGN